MFDEKTRLGFKLYFQTETYSLVKLKELKQGTRENLVTGLEL